MTDPRELVKAAAKAELKLIDDEERAELKYDKARKRLQEAEKEMQEAEDRVEKRQRDFDEAEAELKAAQKARAEGPFAGVEFPTTE